MNPFSSKSDSLVDAAAAVLNETIQIPSRITALAKKLNFPEKDAANIYRLWIDRISIADIEKKIEKQAEADLAEATVVGSRIKVKHDLSEPKEKTVNATVVKVGSGKLYVHVDGDTIDWFGPVTMKGEIIDMGPSLRMPADWPTAEEEKQFAAIVKKAGGKIGTDKNNSAFGSMHESVSVKRKTYSWGDLITIFKDSDFSITLHPDDQKKLSKLNAGQSVSFKDETGKTWNVQLIDKKLSFRSNQADYIAVNRSEIFESAETAVVPNTRDILEENEIPPGIVSGAKSVGWSDEKTRRIWNNQLSRTGSVSGATSAVTALINAWKDHLAKNEEAGITEASSILKTPGFKKVDDALAVLDKNLYDTSPLSRAIIKELGSGYAADFREMYNSLLNVYETWEEITMHLASPDL